MRVPRLSDDAIGAAGGRFCAGLERVAPALVPSGRRLLSRIATANWTLEWSLPGWLGDAFGLSPVAIDGLVLANVHGLAFVRLVDDLIDGELDGFEKGEAVLLAGALQTLWLARLRDIVALLECGSHAAAFSPGATPAEAERASGFWSRYRRYSAEWRQASLGDRLPDAPFRAWAEADLRSLASRGAPLKVCCAAACLLGGRERDLPVLEDAIDRLLSGAVLLDHAVDWTRDLAVDRENAFVAYASDLPQTARHREANRRAVLEAILLQDGARPYFAVIRRRFRLARDAARSLRSPGLEAFIGWLDRETKGYAARLRVESRARLQAAVGALLDPPSPTTATNSQGA